MTTATAAKKTTAATVKPPAKKQPIAVTLRRSAGGGGVPKGHYVLILDPKVFGSTGDNWLNGRSYATREEALAAGTKAGAKIDS